MKRQAFRKGDVVALHPDTHPHVCVAIMTSRGRATVVDDECSFVVRERHRDVRTREFRPEMALLYRAPKRRARARRKK